MKLSHAKSKEVRAIGVRSQVRKRTRLFIERRQLIGTREVLIQLAEHSLKLGHKKVAVRRYLMLKTCDYHVPDQLAIRCNQLLKEISPRELWKIEAAVREWHQMLSPGTFRGL